MNKEKTYQLTLLNRKQQAWKVKRINSESRLQSPQLLATNKLGSEFDGRDAAMLGLGFLHHLFEGWEIGFFVGHFCLLSFALLEVVVLRD